MADMKVAIIDAEIVGATKHRFPNLCSMKLSSYHKSMGDVVVLKTDYENLSSYDKVYISKVFTKTIVPDEVLLLDMSSTAALGSFTTRLPPSRMISSTQCQITIYTMSGFRNESNRATSRPNSGIIQTTPSVT